MVEHDPVGVGLRRQRSGTPPGGNDQAALRAQLAQLPDSVGHAGERPAEEDPTPPGEDRAQQFAIVTCIHERRLTGDTFRDVLH